MEWKNLFSVGMVICLSAAGSYLLQGYREEYARTDVVRLETCDPDIVLKGGRLTVLAGTDNHPGGTLAGSFDGRIVLVTPDGTVTDFTACLAARLNAGTLKELPANGTASELRLSY